MPAKRKGWRPEIQNYSTVGYICIFISITHGSDSPQLAAFYKNAERSEVQANTPQLAAGKFIDVNRIKKNRAFDETLNKLRNAYLEGERDFKPAARRMIDQFLDIKEKRNGKPVITFKTKAVREAKKYNGVFVLVANKEKDPFESLRKFRKREWIEDFFEEYKQRVGGRKHCVWDDLTVDGKKLVQFVALCYYEHFSGEITRMKNTLGVPNGEHDHDLKVNLDKEKQLKTWLENNSIQEIFDWFDAVEKIDVTTPYAKQIWTTEAIARDQLFLNRLGVEL